MKTIQLIIAWSFMMIIIQKIRMCQIQNDTCSCNLNELNDDEIEMNCKYNLELPSVLDFGEYYCIENKKILLNIQLKCVVKIKPVVNKCMQSVTSLSIKNCKWFF